MFNKLNEGTEFEFYFLFSLPPPSVELLMKFFSYIYMLMLRTKNFLFEKIGSNIIDHAGHMVFKIYSSFFSDWVCQSLCQKRVFFGLRQKDFFFLYQILAVIPYFVFLIWAMTFLYSCFILSEISNYLSFSWIVCFIISAFPILSLLFSVLCHSLLRQSPLYSCHKLDLLLLSRLLQSCHPRISLYRSAGLVSLFLGFFCLYSLFK